MGVFNSKPKVKYFVVVDKYNNHYIIHEEDKEQWDIYVANQKNPLVLRAPEYATGIDLNKTLFGYMETI